MKDFTEEELTIIKRALVRYRLGDWRQVQSVYENEVKPLDELIEKLDAWGVDT